MTAESLVLLAKAAGLGLLLAVPVGPIGLLCLRRSLMLGTTAGMAVGLGAATADAIYAGIAAFAMGAAASFIAQSSWLSITGGIVLLALGLRDLGHRQAPLPPPTLRRHVGAYTGTILLTMANPATVLTFAAIIVGLGLVPDLASMIDRLVFVAGVFLGSTAWWIVLSTAAGRLGHRLSPRATGWARRAAGVVFVGFGLYAIVG